MYDKQSPFSVNRLPGRRDSLSDSAHATLRAAIIDCQIAPGQAVSEAELSARFAFGLAAVRAAVMRLTASGWIAPDGRRGSVILPVSAAHLADLSVSRQCLEPALIHHAPPSDLGSELRLRAAVHHGATLQGPGRQAPLHQERDLMGLIALAVAAPRIRGWLIDTWELCLRADRHLEQSFGMSRDALPLPALAVAVADGDAPAATALLERMRHDFDLRASRALARSAVPLSPAPAPAPAPPPRRGAAPSTDHRSGTTPGPRSTKGDPA